jgi:hypothetical protein
MKIHLLDVDRVPKEGSTVEVNCGIRLTFKSVDAEFDDSRVCEYCLEVHREKRTALTLATVEK